MFHRAEVKVIASRIAEPRRFLQIVIGPRQVGKSTAIAQALKAQDLPFLLHVRMPRLLRLAHG